MSFRLAVRMRLPTDVAEALVDVRERLLLGEVGEWGLVEALLPGESGCGNGTGVDILALEDAMMGGCRHECEEYCKEEERILDAAVRRRWCCCAR